ncbi:hypothetical protein BDZ94DRAFT_1247735, partial [Collybia nuda]
MTSISNSIITFIRSLKNRLALVCYFCLFISYIIKPPILLSEPSLTANEKKFPIGKQKSKYHPADCFSLTLKFTTAFPRSPPHPLGMLITWC